MKPINPISDNTLNSLFIRTYQPKTVGHSHHYDQILIPLKGHINLTLSAINDDNTREVILNYGEALVIKCGYHHQFYADTGFRFLVVNLDDSHLLLANKHNLSANQFVLNDSVLLYLTVIEKQLTSTVNPKANATTQRLMFELLIDLLGALAITNNKTKKIDSRLTKVIIHLKQDLAREYNSASMATLACISESHFKTLFKEQMGYTATNYLIELRMQKAMGLLLNTDMPIAIVAEQCGYQSVSSFIRRFAKFYGNTPAKLRDNPNLSLL